MRSVPTPIRVAALLAAALTLAACARTSMGQEGGEQAIRNVVVFVSDDHSQDLGVYGNSVIQTPNLDALASEGTLFRYAYATTASCSASRSVILTGLHNHRTGQYGHVHDFHHFQTFDHIRSLPVLLQEAGYRTARIGKYHVAPESVYRFEEVLSEDQRNPIAMADAARAFITRATDRPFFLYLATSDPHRAGELEAGDVPTGSIGEMLAPNSFGNRPGGYPGEQPVVYDPADVIVPPFLPDNPVTRAELAQYYQSVSRVDQGFGRLVEILKEAGVYEHTLIIYLSDHGIAMPGAKTTVYEPGLLSPLIVRRPGQERTGIRSNALVSWVDLTPTILDFAGVEPPQYDQFVQLEEIRRYLPEVHGLHGRSFLGILEEEDPRGWDVVYASHTFHEIQMYYPMRVVRDRRFKLIWNVAHGLPYPFASDLWKASTWRYVYEKGMDAPFGVRSVRDYIFRPAFELYDMEHDPHEAVNLAGDPRYVHVVEEYKRKLRAFQIRTGDPWLLKWDYE